MSVKDADLHTSGTGDPKKDFNDLLDLAGQLQDKCDRNSQRLLHYRFAEGAFLGSAVAVAVLVSLFSGFGESGALYVTLGAILGIVYAAPLEFVLARKVATHLRRDRRSLSEVVELLRDAERSLAEHEQLTPLERARLRVQFSRFDI